MCIRFSGLCACVCVFIALKLVVSWCALCIWLSLIGYWCLSRYFLFFSVAPRSFSSQIFLLVHTSTSHWMCLCVCVLLWVDAAVATLLLVIPHRTEYISTTHCVASSVRTIANNTLSVYASRWHVETEYLRWTSPEKNKYEPRLSNYFFFVCWKENVSATEFLKPNNYHYLMLFDESETRRTKIKEWEIRHFFFAEIFRVLFEFEMFFIRL